MSDMEETELPLTKEAAHERFAAAGVSVFFQKVLTTSDTSGSGRIVIPKSVAEANFPPIEGQTGIMLTLVDVFGKKHTFKFRYWINNASRMYLIEGTHELQHRFKMGVGDALMFAKGESETIHVCGRKGSPEDFARKPPLKRKSEGGESKAKRAASAAPSGADGSGGRTPAGGGQLKSKRTQQKHPRQPREEVPEVQNAYTYWAGLSLPAKVDGVFRAMPNAAPRDSSGVEAQFGFWSAIVTLGGERFQAFFNSQEHAMAAYDAALQTADGA